MLLIQRIYRSLVCSLGLNTTPVSELDCQLYAIGV